MRRVCVSLSLCRACAAGDDPVDFDYEQLLSGAFKNATAILNDTWVPQRTKPPAQLAASAGSFGGEAPAGGRTRCAGAGGTVEGALEGAWTQSRRDGETDIASRACRSEHPGKASRLRDLHSSGGAHPPQVLRTSPAAGQLLPTRTLLEHLGTLVKPRDAVSGEGALQSTDRSPSNGSSPAEGERWHSGYSLHPRL